MIYINRVDRPSKLTDELIKKLTDEYKIKNSSVWNKDFIKDVLLEMTSNKCCYCECSLNGQGTYMEVEHFHPKSLYPDEVVKWENLLPVCKTCNMYKGATDTKNKQVFIDPSKDNPKDYFMTENFRYVAKNDTGKNIIKLLQLNSVDRVVTPRFMIGNEIISKIEKMYECILKNVDIKDGLRVYVNELREVLKLVQRDKLYSAVISSTLLNNKTYKQTKEIFKKHNYWDDNLIRLEQAAKVLAFDKVV